MAIRLLHQAPTLTLSLTLLSPSNHHRSKFLHLFSLHNTPIPPLSYKFKPHNILPVQCFSLNGELRNEAHEAIVSLLIEHGASEEDAIFIASNSPNYLQMILDSVHELDELGLWDSWNNGLFKQEGIEISGLGFGKKVYYMAKCKGDKGILPFLESLGVKLSSAKVIVSYLQSDTLPNLLNKFLKEGLFCGDTDTYKKYTGRNAKRMMVNLSIQADEDIQSTLSFFQKMDARHGGLEILGCGRVSFPLLIESFPRLLLCSVENHLQHLFELLASIGVPRDDVASILLCFPPAFFYDVQKTIKLRISALEKVWDKKEIPRMLVKYPWILSACILANYNQILRFFFKLKVPKRDVDAAIQSWPHILGLSLQRLNRALDCFSELSVSKQRLVPVITKSPQLLLRKPSEFSEVVLFLEELEFDHPTIGKTLCRYPKIFAASVENTLRRKIKFLIDFGFSNEHMPRIVRKYPELLVLDPDKTLHPRLKYLISIGIPKWKVCSMVHRFSPLLGYSIENVIKPKLKFLLNTMRKPLREIVIYPRYFSYSLEKKIKPRYFILKQRNAECNLEKMLYKSDDDFAEEFMSFDRLLLVPNKIDSGERGRGEYFENEIN
ncbi:mitochondrial transcription termination factor family protein isoform X2 [Carex rostrata]